MNFNSKRKQCKKVKNAASAFITKTFEILEEAKYTDIVDWNETGTMIVIKKTEDFSEKVLATYFKHKNLNSFIRQLNMYSFHKKRTQTTEAIYYHELFQKGKQHLLEQIKRKNQDNLALDSSDATSDDVDSTSQEQAFDVTKVFQERNVLKKLNNQAADKMNNMEGKIKDLSYENDSLKRKIGQHEDKDKILFSLVANILRKYGIPPTELSSILNDAPAGGLPLPNFLQQSSPNHSTPPMNYQQQQQQHQDFSGFNNQVPNTNCESDRFLNLENNDQSFALDNNVNWNEFGNEWTDNNANINVAQVVTNSEFKFDMMGSNDASYMGKRNYVDGPNFQETHDSFYEAKMKRFQYNY